MSPEFSVADFIALTNQSLEYVFPSVTVIGEVSSFKVSQQKYVFFDLKDAGGSVGCFMSLFSLKIPLEDGMKIAVTATAKLTQWGKFSLTVRSYKPIGQGSIKKGLALQREKLQQEGLFDEARKRPLPVQLQRIGVISSKDAAGYADFIKIANERWGGAEIIVAHTQVQGDAAPKQMIRALRYLNEMVEAPQIIVMTRGGGSADDLMAFNDEMLVREVVRSRVPVLAAIGHEVDESFCELAADARASTPSHAAQLLFPDRHVAQDELQRSLLGLVNKVAHAITDERRTLKEKLQGSLQTMEYAIAHLLKNHHSNHQLLSELNPERVLARGYATLMGRQKPGEIIKIVTQKQSINAKIISIKPRGENT